MAIRKNITVTNRQDKWMPTQISKGRCASDGETCRESIRERQAGETENLELQAIRAALIEAEKQGFSDRTPEQIKAAVIERKRGSCPL